MKKADFIYWTDIILLLSFLLVGITGLLKFYHIVPFGLRPWLWNDIHDWSGIVMVVAAVVHVFLHWNWLVCMTKRKLGIGKKKCE